MPKFNFAVPHNKTRDEAKAALKAYFEKSREFYAKQLNDMTEDWSAWDAEHRYGFGFSTFGFNIKGAMTVDDKQVAVEGDLPFAAMMFKGKVEESFHKMVDRALGTA